MNDPLDDQTKDIVFNVYTFFVRKKRDVKSIEYEQDIDITEHMVEITGLSKNIINEIIQEGKETSRNQTVSGSSFKSSKKVQETKKKITLRESDLIVIKRIVNQFHAEEKKMPSLQKLKTVLREEGIVDCGVKYLSTLLHKLGFNYKKYELLEFEIEFGEGGYESSQPSTSAVAVVNT